jgi:hypothetical protein
VNVKPAGERTWIDESNLRVGSGTFELAIDPGRSAKSQVDRFWLLKSRPMVEQLVGHAPDRVENIFDLGIFLGGSVVLYHELFRPKRLVGIDLRKRPVEALDEFVTLHSLEDTIHLHYDTPQDDQERLRRIVQKEFGDEPLDLVVDDCSHQYEPTKKSLNVLLPHVRPGGVYAIEDWGWAHLQGDRWQGRENPYAREPWPLSRLIFELVMTSASRPGLIKSIDIGNGTMYLTRGDESLSDIDFDISESYLTSGRQVLSRIPRLSWPTKQEIRRLYQQHLRRPSGP